MAFEDQTSEQLWCWWWEWGWYHPTPSFLFAFCICCSAERVSRAVCVCSVHVKLLQSCLTLCDHMDYSPQAPLSKGFSRQEYWSGLPCPPPGDLPDPGIEPASLMSPALAGGFFTTSSTCSTSQSCVGALWKAVCLHVPWGWVVIWPVEMKDVTSTDRMDGQMLWERTK